MTLRSTASRSVSTTPGTPSTPARLPPARPSLYGVKVTGALSHTQGGLVVDAAGRVLRTDGTPVSNLHAGGGTAAGLSGHGPGGYFSDNGLLTAPGYGMLAGRDAARAIGLGRRQPRG